MPIENRRIASSALLSLPFQERAHLATAIARRLKYPCEPNQAIALLGNNGKPCTPLSLFIETPSMRNDLDVCRDKTKALVLERNEAERLLIKLLYDADKRLYDCHVEMIKLTEIPDSDIPRLIAIADESKEERSKATLSKLVRKIGRNEPCPCGSGKKFKKCCGR